MKPKPSVRYLATGYLVALLLVAQPLQAQGERGAGMRPLIANQRVALVIGNAAYDVSIGKLRNPVSDADDMAQALERLGFALIGGKAHLNLSKRQMLELIREFGSQIRKGGVGVFYFAGHGVQVDRHNYLIPITDVLTYQEEAEYEAVDVDQVLSEMERAENSLNILILDACRNNNLLKKSRNAERGLGEPKKKPSGVFIAFAARDGQVALENPDGRNGLYTQELLKNLETPDLRLDDIFRMTGGEVKRLSNKRQEPIVYNSLDEIFYLKVSEDPGHKRPSSTSSGPSPTSNLAIITAEERVSPERAKEAETLLRQGKKAKFEQANALFTRAIELNPGYAEAYFSRGSNHLIKQIVTDRLIITIPEDKQRFEAALADFNKAIEINPNYGEAYEGRGFIYRKLGDYEEALSDYNKALEINSASVEALKGRALVRTDKGKYDDALADLNSAVTLAPKDSVAYYLRGQVYTLKGEYEQAIREYTNAIKIDSKCANCYGKRADAYEKIGRKDLAESDRKKHTKLK